MKATVAFSFGLIVVCSTPAFADDLGRLFLSPEQRATLDAKRKARIPDKPAMVVVESPVTRVDGLVTRGSGKSTVWVNGEPIPEGSQPEGLRVTSSRSDSGRVIINVGESGNQVDLKIGQSFDRDTGEVRSLLKGEEIKLMPRPLKK